MLRIVTRKSLAYLFVYFPFLLLVSLPVLQAGFFSDDIINSLLSGNFANQKVNFLLGIMQYMNDALVIGRFYPLSVLSSVSMFYLFPHVTTYQVVRLIFIWLSIFSYAWLIKQITKLSSAAWLFIILVPMCWSIRDMPDPIVSFALLLPLLSLWMSLSVIYYIHYQKSGVASWRSWSLLMYLFALATYEFGLTTLFLLVVMSVLGPDARKHPYRDLRPFLLLTVGYVAVNVALRLGRVDGYDGILVGPASGFMPAFLAQLFSSFPLSYRLLAGEPSISFMGLIRRMSETPFVLMIVMYVYVLLLITTNKLFKKINMTRQAMICVMAMGLTLMVIPSAMIATSIKYQHIISAGKGYLGVYLQYFGFSMLLIALISWLNQCVRTKFFHPFMAVMVSSLLLYSWLLNSYVVMTVNNRLSNQRLLMESALQHHLLSELPNNAIVITPLFLWNNADFYLLHSGMTPQALVDIHNLTAAVTASHHSYFIDAHHLVNASSGYVLLGQVEGYHAMKMNATIAMTDHITTHGLKIFIAAKSQAELDGIIGEIKDQADLNREDIAIILKHLHNSDYPLAASVMLPAHSYHLKIQIAGIKT